MSLEVLFIRLLNMSITASYVILAVTALRLLMKKAPKWVSCALWALVGLRLIFPFSLESVLSLIPSGKTVTSDILYAQVPSIQSGIEPVNNFVNPILSASLAPEVGASANPMQILMHIAGLVWVTGAAILTLYAAISYLKLRRKISAAVPLRENIYQCEMSASPFILGLFRPKIYLPFTLEEADAAYVIVHEQAHIRRKDYWIKPFGFLLLIIYWFNPLVWVAYILLCRDIELACDERVIREIGGSEKKAYSKALLDCAVKRKTIAMCPLAFGEVGVRERVKNVLNYKKPAFWMVVVALLSCAAVAVGLLTTSKDVVPDETGTDLNDNIETPNAETLNYIITTNDSGQFIITKNGQVISNDEILPLSYSSRPSGLTAGVSIKKLYATSKSVLAEYTVYNYGYQIPLRVESNLFRAEDGAWKLIGTDSFITDNNNYTKISVFHPDVMISGKYKIEMCITSNDSIDIRNITASGGCELSYLYKTVFSVDENFTCTGIPYGVYTRSEILLTEPGLSLNKLALLSGTGNMEVKLQTNQFKIEIEDGYYGWENECTPLYVYTDVGGLLEVTQVNRYGTIKTVTLDLSGYSFRGCYKVFEDSWDTGYRIFLMDDEIWIGHWQHYGSDSVWGCEYIVKIQPK